MRTTAALLLSLLSVWSASAGATMLSLAPPDQSSGVGGQVQVSVNVSGLTNGLGAYGFSLLYDPSILAFNGAVDGGGLGQPGIDTLGLAWDTFDGAISLFDVSFLDPAGLRAFQSQDFLLLTLTFDTLAAGVSPLTFADVSLADADGTAITADLARRPSAARMPSSRSVETSSTLPLRIAVIREREVPASSAACACVSLRRETSWMIRRVNWSWNSIA